ncbi:MAG: glycosyltransferase family 2 protein [Clostridia bacterium]|nr:glycosyltransferase family 2 protein [Clostridia bacterium]
MQAKSVTAVITTYARPFDLLEQSLLSVLRQDYSPLEVVVVDDNGLSSPFAKDIAEGMKAYPNVRLIQHEENRGAQVSRNDAILFSTGELIAFLDDDDYWLEGKLSAQVEAFEEDVGMVFCQGYLCKIEEGKPEKRVPYNMSNCFLPNPTFADMLYGDYIGTTTQAMISRRAFAMCGLFDPDQPARQDYQMWLRISKKLRCVGVEKYLFVHTHHEKSGQISKVPVKAITGFRRILREFADDFRKSPVALCHCHMMIAREYRRGNDRAGYMRHMIKAALVAPRILFHMDELKKRRGLHASRVSAGA